MKHASHYVVSAADAIDPLCQRALRSINAGLAKWVKADPSGDFRLFVGDWDGAGITVERLGADGEQHCYAEDTYHPEPIGTLLKGAAAAVASMPQSTFPGTRTRVGDVESAFRRAFNLLTTPYVLWVGRQHNQVFARSLSIPDETEVEIKLDAGTHSLADALLALTDLEVFRVGKKAA